MSKSITLNESEMGIMHSTLGELPSLTSDQLELYLKLHEELGYTKIDRNDIIDMFAEIQNYIRMWGRLVHSEREDMETHMLINSNFNLKSVLADNGVGTYLRSNGCQTFVWHKDTQSVSYQRCNLNDLIELHKQIRRAKKGDV